VGTNLVPEDKELQTKKENGDHVCYFTQRRKRGEQISTRNTINDSARSEGIISFISRYEGVLTTENVSFFSQRVNVVRPAQHENQ